MRRFTVFVYACAVLVLILTTTTQGEAIPDPCILWHYRHRPVEITTPKPDASVELVQLPLTKKRKFNKLEKLIGEWLFMEELQETTTAPAPTTTTTTTPNLTHPMDEAIAGYVNFLSYLFNL